MPARRRLPTPCRSVKQVARFRRSRTPAPGAARLVGLRSPPAALSGCNAWAPNAVPPQQPSTMSATPGQPRGTASDDGPRYLHDSRTILSAGKGPGPARLAAFAGWRAGAGRQIWRSPFAANLQVFNGTVASRPGCRARRAGLKVPARPVTASRRRSSHCNSPSTGVDNISGFTADPPGSPAVRSGKSLARCPGRAAPATSTGPAAPQAARIVMAPGEPSSTVYGLAMGRAFA